MRRESGDGNRGFDKAAWLRTGGLAVALGVASWLLVPLLLPVKVPADFPVMPDGKVMNQRVRELVRTTDKEARRRPGSAEAMGKLGMVYHANLLFAPAGAAYRIAARLGPSDPQWVYAQAFLQEEMGGDKEQVKLLEQTLQLQPGHVPALLKLADWSFKVDRLDDAERHYAAAARVPGGTGSLQAGYGLGRVAARRRQWNQVIEAIAPLAVSHADAAPLHELLGEAYGALRQVGKATEARQNGAAARWKDLPPLEDPFNDSLTGLCYSSTRLLKQAGLLSRAGYPERALEVGRRALQAEPEDADVRNFVARTLLTSFGDKPESIDEAITQLTECLRLRPRDPVPLGGFANEFFKAPKPPQAVARLRDLLRSRPDIPGAHFLLGLAADALDETGEAVSQYRAALQENPNNSTVYNKLGLLAERAGRPDEALAQFQKAIQLNPLNTDARLNLAIELLQRGQLGQGLKQLDELLRINPHDPAAHFCLAFAMLSSNRSEEAVARFRLGLRYKPGDSEARFGLGSALAAQGRREEARGELQEALRLRPNHSAARRLLEQLAY